MNTQQLVNMNNALADALNIAPTKNEKNAIIDEINKIQGFIKKRIEQVAEE